MHAISLLIFLRRLFLLSRYEEYLPFEADKYGRYPHADSLAWKEGFLHLPLINIWINDLKVSLLNKFPGLHFSNLPFKHLPTYDIDIAWSYINKGYYRNTGGMLKSVLKGNWKRLKQRIEVLSGVKKDPFDAYDWLNKLHLQCGIKAYYFFLLAFKQRSFDKNISPFNNALHRLVKSHADNYYIGIHPSWHSAESEDILKKEIKLLEYMAGRKIMHSRQHYLRFTLPASYQKLVRSGISKDYSMGYGGINGFRASVASSFYWYDLQKEEKSNLLIYPFCFMDSCAYYEQKLTPLQACEQLVSYHQTIKKINGLMITIWHNHFLGTAAEFAGWREVYELFLKEQVYKGG